MFTSVLERENRRPRIFVKRRLPASEILVAFPRSHIALWRAFLKRRYPKNCVKYRAVNIRANIKRAKSNEPRMFAAHRGI